MRTLIAILFVGAGIAAAAQTTLTLQPGPVDGIDAHLKEIEANVNFGNHPDFIAYYWTFSGDTSEGRSLLKFDLSVLPANAIILDAKLSLYHNPTSSSAGQYGINESYLKVVTGPWIESAVTWATMPPTTMTNAVLLPTSTSSTQNYLNINVTSHVSSWHSAPATNHGFMIETIHKSTYRSLKFCSSDHTTPTLRPKLVIEYDTIGIPPPAPCPSYNFLKIEICEGDSVWLQGGYQKLPAIYFDTLANFLNQDSIIVTALYVLPSINIVNTIQICDGDSIWIAGAWQKTQGLFQQSFTSSIGCDSTLHTQIYVIKLDSTVTLTGTTLTANQSGASYQWIDCDVGFLPITGATSQSFTPAINGFYAVIITKDGCTVISPCVRVGSVFVPEPDENNSVLIYPNPVSGIVNVDLGTLHQQVEMTVVNSAGQIVYYQQLSEVEQVHFSMAYLPSGTYMVYFNVDGLPVTKSVVKE